MSFWYVFLSKFPIFFIGASPESSKIPCIELSISFSVNIRSSSKLLFFFFIFLLIFLMTWSLTAMISEAHSLCVHLNIYNVWLFFYSVAKGNKTLIIFLCDRTKVLVFEIQILCRFIVSFHGFYKFFRWGFFTVSFIWYCFLPIIKCYS